MITHDNLTPEQRATVERYKRERAALTNPADRIAFDNSGGFGVDFVLHLIAATESTPPPAEGAEAP